MTFGLRATLTALCLSTAVGAALAQTPPAEPAEAASPLQTPQPETQTPDALTPPDAAAPPPTEAAAAPAAEPTAVQPATPGLALRDLAMMDRVSDPQLSPDGRQVLYSVRATDWDENGARNAIWLADVDGRTPPRELAISEGKAAHPRWAADGRAIYFLSSRGGSSQVWRTDTAGMAATQVTALPLDVSGFEVAPGGDALLLSVSVFVDCDTLECTRDRIKAGRENPAQVIGYDRLPLRVFDRWHDGRRSHLFLQPLNGSGLAEGAVRDLTPGFDADVRGQLQFTADGRALIFAARAGHQYEAFSTNSDLWRVELTGGAPRNLTPGNPAADFSPALSPNGRQLAWLANSRDGLSGDRSAIMLGAADGSGAREVAPDWDRSPNDLSWSEDGRTLLVTAQDLGQTRLFAVDPRTGAVRDLSGDGAVSGHDEARGRLVFAREDFTGPAQLYATRVAGGEPVRLTDHNAEVLARTDLPEPEYFTFPGWNDEPVQGWVFRPAGYVPGQTYPTVYLIHGGPKSPWTNSWSYRWNPQVYTGAGYAVVMVNFHGSPGFGQAFVDAINEHWGDRPLEDLQKGWAHAVRAYDFIDESRACALGASYGGYMVNMIAGRWNEPWNCLVNHAGVFDVPQLMNAMDIGTFISEFGGPTWERLELYQQHNPATYVGEWRKPMLVLHGSRDFRVPMEQGLATFSALQRMGVESRFVHVPDENHWVLRPRNWVQWQQEILDWTARYTAP